MKCKTVQFLLALLLVFFTASAVGGKNNHAKYYPKQFMGSMTGEAVGDFVSGACLPVTGAPWQTISSVSGWLTHMGHSEYFSTHCSTLDGSALVNGEATLVAEDGDEVWLTYSAELLSTFPAPQVVYLVRNRVEGGTGRFEHAHGDILMIVIVTPDFSDPFAPMPLMMTFSGKLKY
jgi:hypothetical protein